MKVTKKDRKEPKTGIAKNLSDLISDYEPKNGEQKMTIQRLAEKSGVGVASLKRFVSGQPDENGNKRLPNSDDLLALAKALDVSPYKLLTGNDDENNVVCEELGLSNDTINKLKKKNKLHLPYMQIAIDYLVSYPPILLDIYLYLTQEYKRIDTDDRTLFPEDIERIDRLSILDDLSQLRTRIKGEMTNEKG